MVGDSKTHTEAEREALYDVILAVPGVRWAAASVDHKRIDEINILQVFGPGPSPTS